MYTFYIKKNIQIIFFLGDCPSIGYYEKNNGACESLKCDIQCKSCRGSSDSCVECAENRIGAPKCDCKTI